MAQHVTSSQIKSGFLVGRRGKEELEMGGGVSEEALGSKVGLPLESNLPELRVGG